MQRSSTKWWRNLVVLPLLVGLVTCMLPTAGQAQLSGTYTIGSGGSYTTFTAAVTALTTSGVSGPVTFNVLAGTFTETFTIPVITGASAANSITFNGGTGNASTRIITYDVTASYGSVITLNGADYVAFKNLTINSVNATYGYGFLFTNSADYNEISNCVINLPATTTSAYHMGICASTTTSYSTAGDHGNYNLIQSNTINSGYYGIRWNGSATTDYTVATGNQFIGNTLNNWYYYGMYLYYIGGAVVVQSNSSVQRTTGTFTTTSGYAYYIYYPNNGPNISYNYGSAAYGAFYIYYMNNAYASTANRAKVYNNMGIVNGTSTAYGLYVNYGKYNDVVYNSIRTTNTTGTAYGIYSYGASTNYDTKIQNNMLSHDGTGTYYPVYCYYPTSHSVFDYNRHYRTGAGTDSYYWNGTTYTTFAAMKAAVVGFHQNSAVGDPEWYSATDLHSTSMSAYHTGLAFTGITNDFDGNTRSATPCIGADEYTLTNMAYSSSTCTQNNTNVVSSGFSDQEIIGIQVAVTGSLSAISATSFTLNTTGTTSASNITAAKIYYTGRSSTFAATNLVGSYLNPSGSFTITGSQLLQGPGTNYFWLTYDIAASAPTGNYVDGQCTSVTVAGTPYTPTITSPVGNRMILSPMNGVYTIDPLGSGARNFVSFTAAVNSLILSAVNGPVTFNVAAATYNEQLVIPPILGASAVNTITFDGGTGNAASRIVTYSVPVSYASVITLNGADYLRFKNLTVNSTNASYGYCFLFTASADYNELRNCVLNVPANTTSSYHIPLVASSTTSYSAYGNWANYNLIKDNTLNSGYYAVTWQGLSGSLTTNVNNEFSGNIIQDFYYYGIYSYYSSGMNINHNRITQRTSGTYTTSGGYAIYNYYPYEGPKYIGNYLKAAYSPMNVVYANSVYSSTAIRGKCLNNMLIANGTSTTYGLYFNYPRYSDIAYNSVYTKTTGTSHGLYQYGASTAYDNKHANNYIVHEGTGVWYPVYSYYVTDISQYDNNAYYRIGIGSNQYYWNASTYTTLAALKAAVTGFHQNSVEGNPYYVSATDLHSRSHVGYQAGIPVTGVTDDFDGDTRPAAPCIGADEYPAPPPENDLAVAEVMLDNDDGKWAHREGTAIHAIKVVLENTGLGANLPSVTVTYKLGSMPANVNDGVQETFTPGWIGTKAAVEFTQTLTGLTAGTTAMVYAKVFWALDEDNTNDGGMDNAYIEIEKVHGIENFEKMDAMMYPFTRDPGYLDLPWNRLNNNGGAALDVMAGMGTTGGNALAMNAPAEAANEWVITPGATLDGGSSYRFGFDFRNWGGAPVTIEAAYGDTPDPTQMTVFATFANIAPGGFLTAQQLAGGLSPYFNTPQFNGTYYVALHFTTSSANAYFSIDNIKLDDNPSPPPKIAFGLPGAALSTFVDNSAYKITVMANYKQPAIINRTYEVQSKTNIYGAMGDFLWDVESTTPWITLTKETPNPTLQNYNFVPPRPRQFQTFTMSINPAGLPPGTHIGEITFYGILFNNDYPPPANGLVATNEPLSIEIDLIITNSGSKGVPYLEKTIATPLTVPGSSYDFIDPTTGNPIATVEVTSGQIDMMTIRAYPNQLPQNLQRKLFVKRYWQITYTGTGWTANITFPYADAEASMITDKMQLRGVRQPVALGPWEDPIMGTSSVSDPLLNSVKVHDFNPSNIGGNIALSQPYFFSKDGGSVLPTQFSLEQNYPNPFNPSTSIVFNVAEERSVRIAVYNSLGAEVAELANEVLPAGRYEVAFDASALPSGTYLYRMLAGEFVATQRMTLSK